MGERVLVLAENSNKIVSDCDVYPLRRNWDLVLSLSYCHYFSPLTASLFLHFLTSLLSNDLFLLRNSGTF